MKTPRMKKTTYRIKTMRRRRKKRDLTFLKSKRRRHKEEIYLIAFNRLSSELCSFSKGAQKNKMLYFKKLRRLRPKNNFRKEEVSDAVCKVLRNEEAPIGTGFLLFDRYVLTNGHVIVNSPPPCSDTPLYMMEFSSSNRKIIMKAQLIEGVCDSSMDFALLELSSNTNLPPSLIQLYGPPSNFGQIKIIGHPGGGGKSTDYSYIENVEQHFLHYKSTFLYGSSGSPGFVDSKLVFMHTGAKDGTGFGISVQSIIYQLLIFFGEEIRFKLITALDPQSLQPFVDALWYEISINNRHELFSTFESLRKSLPFTLQNQSNLRGNSGAFSNGPERSEPCEPMDEG